MPLPHISNLLRVAVVADHMDVATELSRALRHCGDDLRTIPLKLAGVRERVEDLRPDAVIVRAGARGTGLARAFGGSTLEQGLALVLLTPAGSSNALNLAAATGSLVHLIEPLPAQALVAAVHLAVARARERRELGLRLHDMREAVRTRVVVDQAKEVLMRRLGLSEQDAHRRLQVESRNRNRRLLDTARQVIHADMFLSAAPR